MGPKVSPAGAAKKANKRIRDIHFPDIYTIFSLIPNSCFGQYSLRYLEKVR